MRLREECCFHDKESAAGSASAALRDEQHCARLRPSGRMTRQSFLVELGRQLAHTRDEERDSGYADAVDEGLDLPVAVIGNHLVGDDDPLRDARVGHAVRCSLLVVRRDGDRRISGR